MAQRRVTNVQNLSSGRITAIIVALYIAGAVLSCIWLVMQFTVSAHKFAEDTAQLIGNELGAIIKPVSLDALMNKDATAIREVADLVRSAVFESLTVEKMELVDETGEVLVASSAFANLWEDAADEVFDEKPTATVTTHPAQDEDSIQVAVPISNTSELEGYLQVTMTYGPLGQLHGNYLWSVSGMAVLGLLFLLGAGMLSHIYVSSANNRLTHAIENDEYMSTAKKYLREFTSTLSAAETLRSAAQQAKLDQEGFARVNQTVSDLIPLGVLGFDRDGQMRFANQIARDLLGMGGGKEPSADLREFRRYIETLIANTPADKTAIRGQYQMVSRQALQAIAVDVICGEQRTIGDAIIVLRDKHQLESLQDDLRAALRFRCLHLTYTGGTHELRAPLGAMTLNLEMLRISLGEESIPADAKARLLLYVEYLQNDVDRISNSVSALLEQSKESDKTRLLVDLNDLLKETIDLFRTQAELAGITLKFVPASSPLDFVGSPGSLRQVFVNILMNAIEAIKSGGVVTISTVVRNNDYEIIFEDTGVGMPKDIAKRVFDMHFTTKSSGTGIGLYVSRVIVEDHGGDIALNTELGKGTTVRVTLPRYRA
ncbi:MAG: hypothetical protein H6978_08795 [Gammaproteobacteria bacterium]|nr:hypothetical protein [Gammaproteobacteria bacterium]